VADVRSVILNVQSAPTGRAGAERSASKESSANDVYAPDRIIHDTIDISEDGQKKIINLARHSELADGLPDATKDRAAFDAAITQALEDVERITTLFGAVSGQLASNQVATVIDQNPQPESAAQTVNSEGRDGLLTARNFDKTKNSFHNISALLSESFKSIFNKA
jgi:hypothetical protein